MPARSAKTVHHYNRASQKLWAFCFRHGPEGLRQFCRVETIVEDHPLLWWLSPLLGRELTFPYKARTQRLLRWFMRLFY